MPTAEDGVQCRVGTSLVTEDPDLDIVRYRYRWIVDGKLVRVVRSAGLSDVLRKGLAGAGTRVPPHGDAERRPPVGADGERAVGNPRFAAARR
jgi:hypothetical protein